MDLKYISDSGSLYLINSDGSDDLLLLEKEVTELSYESHKAIGLFHRLIMLPFRDDIIIDVKIVAYSVTRREQIQS